MTNTNMKAFYEKQAKYWREQEEELTIYLKYVNQSIKEQREGDKILAAWLLENRDLTEQERKECENPKFTSKRTRQWLGLRRRTYADRRAYRKCAEYFERMAKEAA